MKINNHYSKITQAARCWRGLDPTLVSVMMLLFLSAVGSDSASAATIRIDPKDNRCQPVDSVFASCAAACEAESKGCAEGIHTFINSRAFKKRRQRYPRTRRNNPNPSTPMHGLFNTMYVNKIAKKAIKKALKNPFEPIDLAAWSIIAKCNKNPNSAENRGVEVWETHMYKIQVIVQNARWRPTTVLV